MNLYEDMMTLPHHRSATRARMTQLDRAAQFAPFAALSGYEDEIAEAGRLTDTASELMEGWAQQIDDGLRSIRAQIRLEPLITATYFIPDERKSGGAYRTVTGRVRKLQEYERLLLLDDGTAIAFDRIFEITVQ